MQEWVDVINYNEGGVDKFTKGYQVFGFVINKNNITYREWAPAASEAYLIGEFSN